MANLQALCGSCNLRKGSNPQEIAIARFDVERLAPGQRRTADLADRSHADRALSARA